MASLSPSGTSAAARPRSGNVLLPALGAAAILVALVAMLIASVYTDRRSEEVRDELFEHEAALRALDAVEIDVSEISSEARGFALTGDAELRDRYEMRLARLQGDLSEFSSRARTVGNEDEASNVVQTAQNRATVSGAVVAAVSSGDLNELTRLLNEEGPRRSDEFLASSTSYRASVDEERADLRDQIDSLTLREQIVLVLAVLLGAAASGVLVWLLRRNVRLATAMDQERARLGAVVANVPGIVWEAWGEPDAANQRIDFVSDYIEEMLGYRVDEWLSTPNFWATILHPDDRERAPAEAAAIFASKMPGTSQFRWIARDGRVVEVLSYSSVILGPGGEPAGMRGVTLDIGDRVRAESVLRFTAEASRVLVSSLDYQETLTSVAQLVVPGLADWCAIHVVGDSGEVEQVAVTHADPAQVERALELQQRYPPDPDAPTGIPAVLRTGQSELVAVVPEEMLVAAARDEKHLEMIRSVGLTSYVCVPMRLRDRTLGVLTLASAESGRHYGPADLALAEDLALRAAVAVENARLFHSVESERARLRTLLASVAVGVYEVDADGRLTYMNPAAERILGHRREALQGQVLHDVIHHTRRDGSPNPRSSCPLSAVLSDGTTFSGVDAFIDADERFIDVDLATAPIVVGRRITGAVEVFQDITERAQQDQMKDDFIAFASHELRSPLTSVSGFSRWLARRVASEPDAFDEDTRDAIETLDAEADRMASIVELFLDLTRIESGRLTVDLEEIDLAQLVAEEADALQRRHPDIELAIAGGAAPLVGRTDPRRLRQVVANLLDNGAKYGAGSPLRIHVAADGAFAVIRVRDEGPGIDAEDQAHLFDRFYRGSTSKGRKGLGIGLFITRQIVEKLGGTIALESRPGAGAMFEVRLPLTGPTSAGATAGPARW